MVTILYDELDILGDTSTTREEIFRDVVLFFLPGMLLGVRLTILGLVVNFIWFDIVFYGWVKFKERLEGED